MTRVQSYTCTFIGHILSHFIRGINYLVYEVDFLNKNFAQLEFFLSRIFRNF